MFTLFDVLGNVKGVLVYIDSIIFGLIDDAYNLIYLFGSNSLIEDTVIKDVIHNLYFVICIFAFFKLAMLLVNAIINPDKLSDKEQGAGKVVINILVMFVLLIAVPIIFTESREITSFILGGTDGKNGNYINKLILGTDINGENPGSTMKKAAISALIFPESDFVDGTSPSDLCTGKCADAVNDYYAGMAEDTADVPWNVLSHYMDVKSKNSDGDEVYVYHYTVLLTAAVGIFITYVLFSFVIDIAIRAVKMAILEMLAPLFIVSYIDPKSAKSGPFHNWVKTTLQVYASLFIKLAVISIMLLLLQKVLPGMNSGAFKGYLFAKIIVILAILIFIKSAPDWISSLIGIKSDDTSFKGIGKQLASAALVGGALTKAGHAALGAATGAVRNAHAYRKAKKVGLSSEKDRAHNRVKSNYSSNRAAKDGKVKSAFKAVGQSYFKKDAMKQNLKNFGTTAAAGGLGFLKGVASGGKIGATGGDIKDIKAKVKADAKGEFNRLAPGYTSIPSRAGDFVSGKFNKGVESVIGNGFEIDKRKTEAEKSQKARELFGSVTTGSDGKRNKLANPVNSMETNTLVNDMNTKYGTKFDASSMEGITSSLVLANKDKIKGKVEVVGGKVQIDGKNVDTAKVCRDNGIYTPYGEKTMESIAKENAYTKASEYVSNQQNISEANKSAVESATQMQSLIGEMKSAVAASRKDISVQLADMSNCLNNEYIANQKLNEALANGADSSTISKLKQDLNDAKNDKKDATTNLSDAIVDAGGDSGLVNSFIAAASSRAEAFSQINLLNSRNEDIKAEVRRSLEEANANGTTSNFTTVDITTGQSYTFLQDPTQTELVSNLMNKAVTKAKDDASKLKPKSSSDKKD